MEWTGGGEEDGTEGIAAGVAEVGLEDFVEGPTHFPNTLGGWRLVGFCRARGRGRFTKIFSAKARFIASRGGQFLSFPHKTFDTTRG